MCGRVWQHYDFPDCWVPVVQVADQLAADADDSGNANLLVAHFHAFTAFRLNAS